MDKRNNGREEQWAEHPYHELLVATLFFDRSDGESKLFEIAKSNPERLTVGVPERTPDGSYLIRAKDKLTNNMHEVQIPDNVLDIERFYPLFRDAVSISDEWDELEKVVETVQVEKKTKTTTPALANDSSVLRKAYSTIRDTARSHLKGLDGVLGCAFMTPSFVVNRNGRYADPTIPEVYGAIGPVALGVIYLANFSTLCCRAFTPEYPVSKPQLALLGAFLGLQLYSGGKELWGWAKERHGSDNSSRPPSDTSIGVAHHLKTI